jgi:hypothetical protein
LKWCLQINIRQGTVALRKGRGCDGMLSTVFIFVFILSFVSSLCLQFCTLHLSSACGFTEYQSIERALVQPVFLHFSLWSLTFKCTTLS